MTTEDITVNFVGTTQDIVTAQNIHSATSIIDFHSAGNALIVSEDDNALELVGKLAPLKVTIVCVNPALNELSKQLTESGVAVFTTPSVFIEGYLGAFNVVTTANGQETNLAVSVYAESGAFDLVLDLLKRPVLDVELPPLGYFHAPP